MARRDVEDPAERFEEVNEESRAELRALRNEISRMRMIDDALGQPSATTFRWLP
jgi:hypothetical protein